MEAFLKSRCAKLTFFAISLLLRFVFVYVAYWVDETTPHRKYTDEDYHVFSDAATHVYNGRSPYKRHTYRYTPLAAYICLVNNYVHPLAGKIVFCFFDLLMAVVMWSLIESQNSDNKYTLFYVGFWIYNPITIFMSSRGSNDNIIALLVYLSLYFLLKRDYIKAGLVYGLSVHFKIYPIIYCIPLYFYIDCDKKAILQGSKSRCQTIFSNFFTINRAVFALVSAWTFVLLNGLFYYVYGDEFLQEAWLYHLVRKDNRHNYSVYHYLIYQLYDQESSKEVALLMFIPQWAVVIVAGLLFHYDIFLAMVVQTWAFVAFNKVMTAQYQLWYMSLIPFVAINNGIIQSAPWKGLLLYVAQLVFMQLWLYYAVQLEWFGNNTFYEM